MDLKDRKLKIAEFINSVDNDLEYELIVTNMGGADNNPLLNEGQCVNISKACKNSVNTQNCRNSGISCEGSSNSLLCITTEPPPGSNIACGTVNSTCTKP